MPVLANTDGSLTAATDPDPLLLERVINRVRHGQRPDAGESSPGSGPASEPAPEREPFSAPPPVFAPPPDWQQRPEPDPAPQTIPMPQPGAFDFFTQGPAALKPPQGAKPAIEPSPLPSIVAEAVQAARSHLHVDEIVQRVNEVLPDGAISGSTKSAASSVVKDKNGRKQKPPAGKAPSAILVTAMTVTIVFVLWNIFAGGKSGFTLTPGVDLSGTWNLSFLNSRDELVQGQVVIKQSGNSISGNGNDSTGTFVINGTCNYPKLKFAKQYIVREHPQGRAVLYKGEVDYMNPKQSEPNQSMYMHALGSWEQLVREGTGWKSHQVNRKNNWSASLINRTQPPQPIDLKKLFLQILVGFLMVAGLIVFASLKLFGPAGLINIWAKKKYIPSQYMSEHWRQVHLWGKPVMPGGMPLGKRADWWLGQFYRPREINMPPDVRASNPHLLVLGAGSKGKSRLLASMIAHDITAGDRSVVVVDSDGALIDHLVAWIASHPHGKEIAERLTVIDPSSPGSQNITYNPLAMPDDGDLQSAASALVFGFKAVYTEAPGSQSQWNQQTANILRNAATLLMANGKTLADLPTLLSENDYRDVLLEKIERQKQDSAEFTTLLEAWAQYKRLARTDQWISWVEPILNRVQPMLGDPRIRPILTKPEGDLNLKDILKDGRILFVKVPQGQLDQHANLLGSLVVTGLKQAALSLSLKNSSNRHPCALYLDGFDNFIEKDTFSAITSETRKFQIGFIGAAKTLQGLPEDYRHLLLTNTGTLCCFALTKKDGDMLGPQMFRVDGRRIKHQTLQNIFNKVNTSPQFELIADEEKLNIDRVVAQEDRTYFCYRVGDVAAVFQVRSPEFKDIEDKDTDWALIDRIYGRTQRTQDKKLNSSVGARSAKRENDKGIGGDR
jgi:hypothetical protein